MQKGNVKIKPAVFAKSAKICLDNAERLLTDAELMELEEPPATALSLSILSQEESAKAFLLYLVSCEAIPWNQFVHRSLNDHCSKQLMTIILDRFNPCEEEWDHYLKSMKFPNRDEFIQKVGDVLNIYYYEKIERWRDRSLTWNAELHYDNHAKRIHDGAIDRVKQNAIYVNIGKSGQAHPIAASRSRMKTEKDAAKRYHQFADSLLRGEKVIFQDWLSWLKETFKLFFESSIFVNPTTL